MEETKDLNLKLDDARFRCTKQEKELIKKLAKGEHLTMSAYLMRLVYADADAKGVK